VSCAVGLGDRPRVRMTSSVLVLIIEDEESIQQILVSTFEDGGLAVAVLGMGNKQ